MNLQSIIDSANFRTNAVAELTHAINELDVPGLEQILALVAERIESKTGAMKRAREVLEEEQKKREAFDHKAHVAKTIARAEKGVRTRKANKAKKIAAKKTKPINAGAYRVREELAAAENGITSKQLSERTKLVSSAVYYHLKHLGAYSNGAGLWWTDKKMYLARFLIAKRGGKAKKNALANGAAATP
jgi:predicted Zn-ribbon and HTH transcriptional regulator